MSQSFKEFAGGQMGNITVIGTSGEKAPEVTDIAKAGGVTIGQGGTAPKGPGM